MSKLRLAVEIRSRYCRSCCHEMHCVFACCLAFHRPFQSEVHTALFCCRWISLAVEKFKLLSQMFAELISLSNCTQAYCCGRIERTLPRADRFENTNQHNNQPSEGDVSKRKCNLVGRLPCAPSKPNTNRWSKWNGIFK